MFTFRSTTVVFFILLFGLNVMALAGIHVPWFYYLILTGLYLAISVTMSFFIRSGYHMKAYCSAETGEKIVSLTFDDGPDMELTPYILDALKEKGIPATFFCIGRKIKGNEEILRRMVKEGHLIGTHSYSHSDWFDFFPSRRMQKELEESGRLVFEATGEKPVLFRPPYGVINPMVKRAVLKTGYRVIGFSNRCWDTSSKKREVILARLTRNLRPGDIILLHDTVPVNVDVIREFAGFTKHTGYRIVPLDQLLKITAYAG
jgi:peptidoglycan-N-acetylglucosamine deacetylase